MTDRSEAERVAKGLTKAQARGILSAVEDNGRWFIRSWSNPMLAQKDAKQMRKAGLGFQVWSGFCLGERGLAVRQILQENTDAQ